MHSSSCSIFSLPFSLSDDEEDNGSEDMIERGSMKLGEKTSSSMLTNCDDRRNEMIDAAEKEETTLPPQ